MDVTEKTNLMKKVDAFQGLRESDLIEIANLSSTKIVKKGDFLFNEGDLAHCLYIIYTGVISIYKGSRELVQFSTSDIIGEMSLLDSGSRSATAKAKEDTVLLEISETVFQDLLNNKNFTLLKILKVLSKRIRDNDQKLAIDHMIMTTLIHDLNNTLTCFSAAAIIHRSAEEGSATKKYSEMMMKAQKSMQEMIHAALSSFKTNQVITSKNDKDLAKTIMETCQIHLANHPELKEIHLDLQLPNFLKTTPHNGNDLIRVLSNLIINAAQASKPGSIISILLQYLPNSAEIKIRDQGHGIPDVIKDSLFNPGFTSKPKGNGLGLFSCQNIIEKMHGGKISFVSEEGKGSEFTISLPLE
jgi:signal transduction histidine kinase